MASNELDKPRKRAEKHNQFVGPIVYKNEMPGPSVDCKLLPCGRDILEHTLDPVSYPDEESRILLHFRGLHSLFDFDLVNQSVYDKPPRNVQQMDPRDAALLADIDALDCGYGKPKSSRAQECAQMFAKERVQAPRPRPPGLQRPAAETKKIPKSLPPISLEQQKQLIDRTFEEIKKPLLRHPTKPRSNARPVAILPIFPDSNLQNYNFIQMQFDIAPTENSQNLIKDCGNYLINFNATQDICQSGEQLYLSDQRYKEEKAPENAERGERLILIERDAALYYVSVEKHIKLRRERPRPQAVANKCLLQVKRVPMESK
ncbi:uncharacterized protein LOC108148027 [Drosophila elegans]|uniref:uncharacterized protein LOC108148027 n=1 Tax=Drosophila elegans TaxID=30023 RepID=UPI0007E7B65B|nr:uncharacterized protein LOC108148027 [Drosophila elegans]